MFKSHASCISSFIHRIFLFHVVVVCFYGCYSLSSLTKKKNLFFVRFMGDFFLKVEIKNACRNRWMET